jgi:hypothetical protein
MKPIATLDDAKSWIDSGFPEPTTVMALDLTALDGRFAKPGSRAVRSWAAAWARRCAGRFTGAAPA